MFANKAGECVEANMFSKIIPTLFGMALCCLVSAIAFGAQSYSSNYKTPAHFKVTNDIVNKDVTAFTATIPGIGNSLIDEGSGFEPVVYRNKYKALENSSNRVVVSAVALSYYDTLREGFLDGADVFVYRIENAKFSMVREDKVAEGGFHVSGWVRAIKDNQVLPPDTTRFTFRWSGWNRPREKYYFTVKAIDRSGNLSAPATAFAIERPENTGKNEPIPSFVEFKPSRLTLDSTRPSAPGNLRGRLIADGALVLEWDPVAANDLAGYVVFRSDYPPDKQTGHYLQLTRIPASVREQIKAGDMVIVSKKFYSTSRNRYFSNRVWNAWNEYNLLLPGLVEFFPDENPGKAWELVRHKPDTPVEEPGETYLKLDLAAGVKESIGIWNHSGTDQDWYEVLEKRPYKVEVWLRRQAGYGSVRFKFNGFYDQQAQAIEPTVFNVGPEWKKFVATFTPPVVMSGAQPNRMGLEFTGPGTFSVDNFRVYRADTGYLDYLPHQYQELKSSGIQALRTHAIIKTGFRTYDMAQITNSGGVMSARRTSRLNTLPQLLKVMRKAGVRPWLQMEFHMNPQEWLAFAEYMAAPYDPKSDTPISKPWAYKRFKQGQAKPWVDEFDRFYFELGNETWNGLFYPWIFDDTIDSASGKNYTSGQVYGMFQEYVISILRSSPYWRRAKLENKFVFVLGGWAAQRYGRDAASVSPSSQYLTIAAYNGGWDEGEGPPKVNPVSMFNVLAQVNQSAIPAAADHANEVADLNSKDHGKLRIGTYEAGPGYALDGLNNARVTEEQAREQEQVMKSMAAGAATLDSFLARAYRGFDIQNFFTFHDGAYWSSHAKWYRGGQFYPSWKLIALFNNEATGDMLRTETLSVPGIDLQAFQRRRAVQDAPLTAVYATRKANRFSLLVLSRKVPDYPVAGDGGFTPVTIDLPFSHAKSITLFRMTGDPRANNLLVDNVKIEKIDIPASHLNGKFALNARNGADDRGLAPASTFLYVFDGIDNGGGIKPTSSTTLH